MYNFRTCRIVEKSAGIAHSNCLINICEHWVHIFRGLTVNTIVSTLSTYCQTNKFCNNNNKTKCPSIHLESSQREVPQSITLLLTSSITTVGQFWILLARYSNQAKPNQTRPNHSKERSPVASVLPGLKTDGLQWISSSLGERGN